MTRRVWVVEVRWPNHGWEPWAVDTERKEAMAYARQRRRATPMAEHRVVEYVPREEGWERSAQVADERARYWSAWSDCSGQRIGCEDVARALRERGEPDGLASVYAALETAEARLAEAREVLTRVQWLGARGCPDCARRPSEGHAPECRLAAVLGDS
jgi:hypothetical protein